MSACPRGSSISARAQMVAMLAHPFPPLEHRLALQRRGKPSTMSRSGSPAVWASMVRMIMVRLVRIRLQGSAKVQGCEDPVRAPIADHDRRDAASRKLIITPLNAMLLLSETDVRHCCPWTI